MAHLALWSIMLIPVLMPGHAAGLLAIAGCTGIAAFSALGARRGVLAWRSVLADALAMGAVSTLVLLRAHGGHHGLVVIDLTAPLIAAVVIAWACCRLTTSMRTAPLPRSAVALAPMLAMFALMLIHGH